MPPCFKDLMGEWQGSYKNQSINVGDKLFISLLVSHENYSPVIEIPLNPYSKRNKLELLFNQKAYTTFRFKHESGKSWIAMLVNQDSALGSSHTFQILETDYSWEESVYFQPIHTNR